MTFIMTVLALLSVFLIGLPALAALLAYYAELVRNIRIGIPQPLPRWDNLEQKMRRGVNILLAYFVYNLPNLLLSGCIALSAPAMGDTFIAGTGVTLLVACCIFPMLLIYNVIIWPMLTLGVARYNDEPRVNVFFEFSYLFALVQQNSSATIQFLLNSALAWFVLTLGALIPCLGWAVVPALIVPVTGALGGEYARQVLGKPQTRHDARPFSARR